MKVVCISGSPKATGNTATILSEIERPLKEQGIEVVRYCLGSCKINYCKGCKSCFGDSNKCVQNDDVKMILDDLSTSNLVIVASPSYWALFKKC